MSDTATERVLVVPTAVFRRLGYFQGFTSEVHRYVAALFDPEHVTYRPRATVENDSEFKQLIPYVIFRFTDSKGGQSLFQYTRGEGQGEVRLRRRRSVGVGGHISAGDAADGTRRADPYAEGMRRELDEEVRIESPYRARCVGLINDDETDVGRVHLGVVHLFDVERPDVYPREPEIAEAAFRPLETILADIESMETWSQICVRALFDADAGQASRRAG